MVKILKVPKACQMETKEQLEEIEHMKNHHRCGLCRGDLDVGYDEKFQELIEWEEPFECLYEYV